MNWGLRERSEDSIASVDVTLNRLRMRGDPLADAVALRLDTQSPLEALAELRFLAKSEIGIYQELLDQLDSVPADTDFSRIDAGRQVQLAFSPVRHLAWLYGALQQGWAQCPLLRRDQLGPELRRRFLFNHQVNQALIVPHSLQPGGALHNLLLLHRLQLALQRKAVREAGWNTLEFGEPLNQEYLLLMVLEYSTLNLDSMDRLGARLSDTDQAAVAAFWRLVGYWLGLEPGSIPHHREEESLLLERIRWRHSHDAARRADHSQILHAHLLTEAPANLAAHLPAAIMQWCAAPVGTPASPPDRALQLLIVANRGATLAHYHLPGIDSLRQQLHSRQLRHDRAEPAPSPDTGRQTA